jgi:hypothetical protein
VAVLKQAEAGTRVAALIRHEVFIGEKGVTRGRRQTDRVGQLAATPE